MDAFAKDSLGGGDIGDGESLHIFQILHSKASHAIAF